MNTLILHPTELSQWQALVNEAQVNTRLILDEDIESYLVFLLFRFSQKVNWVESLLGLDLLKIIQSDCANQVEKLREIGDKSLLFAGLFPELLIRRRLSLNYYTGIGQCAYLTAASLPYHQFANLFQELGSKFEILQTVLRNVRKSRN